MGKAYQDEETKIFSDKDSGLTFAYDAKTGKQKYIISNGAGHGVQTQAGEMMTTMHEGRKLTLAKGAYMGFMGAAEQVKEELGVPLKFTQSFRTAEEQDRLYGKGRTAEELTAMGVNPDADCSSFSILGKFQIDDGYISTRESGGFIYWASSSGEFIINGGTLDAKQFRTANASGGLTAYRQTGGIFNLRGRIKNVLRLPSTHVSAGR